jgi:hypothetical protein
LASTSSRLPATGGADHDRAHPANAGVFEVHQFRARFQQTQQGLEDRPGVRWREVVEGKTADDEVEFTLDLGLLDRLGVQVDV